MRGGHYISGASRVFCTERGTIQCVRRRKWPPTLTQANVDADAVTINAQNQLERAGIYYNQVGNIHKATIAVAVLSHTADYHSAQAKTLRSAAQTLVWELQQIKGGCYQPIRMTIAQIGYVKMYDSCGIETTWEEFTVDLAGAGWRIATTAHVYCGTCASPLVKSGSREQSSISAAHIRRKTLLLDPNASVHTAFVREFSAGAAIWDEPYKIVKSWVTPFQHRSVWQRRLPTQFRLCLELDNGQVTDRLRHLARNQSMRFISQLCVEEMFNEVKADVSQGTNSRCTAQRAMGTVIDKGVLSQLNNYTEVSRESEPVERNLQLGGHAFQLILRPKLQGAETRDAQFNGIIGTGDADWFAHNAANSDTPFCDILA